MQIQPINITQIIVAIITAASVVISAWLKHKSQKRQKQKKSETVPRKINTWTTIVICIGAILLAANLGVFGLRYWGITTKIEITYPYDGSTVEIREMVRGTSQKIPERQAIWIVIYPHITGCYYPQNDPADVQANGDWTYLTLIGIEEDVSKKFDIIAVLADERAQDIFNTYITQAKDKKTWPGLERLPEGATIYDRITVTRE